MSDSSAITGFSKALQSDSKMSNGAPNAALTLTAALIENADAIQNYINKGIMLLQEKIVALSTQISNQWIQTLQTDQQNMNALLPTIQADASKTDGSASADQSKMTTLSAQANLDNTNYNNQTTTRNSYNDMLSQFSQNTTDITSNAYQMIDQIVNILANTARNL